MRIPLLPLLPNRVRRNYAGGRELDRLEGRAAPADGPRPEDWLASTTQAINRGMPEVAAEGLGRGRDPATGEVCSVAELFREHGEFYLGRAHLEKLGPNLGFLAKLLDSSMRLHTQAHPTRDFARERLGSPYGKLECYVILGVRPGHPGELRLGFQHAPSRDEWREIVATQDIARMDACFDPITVRPGQVWWVPGGQVHALGAGLLLLEVMEPSDLVVRCEFEREGIVVPAEARYMGRDLEFCLDVFDYTQRSVAEVEAWCRVEPTPVSRSETHVEQVALAGAKTRCFEVRTLEVSGDFAWPAAPMCRLVVVAEGEGTVALGACVLRVKTGDRFLVAADQGPVRIAPAAGTDALRFCVCTAESDIA